MVFNQAPADVFWQVRESQWRERRPRGSRGLFRLWADDRLEQARGVVVHPLDDRRGQRWPSQRQQRQSKEDIRRDLGADRPPGRVDALEVVSELAVAPDEEYEPGPVVGASAPHGVELRRGVES